MVTPRSTKKALRYLACSAIAVALALLISNLHNFSAPSSPTEANLGSQPAAERLTPIAERFAPFILHQTDCTVGRQDLISNIDFDGDLIGNNNWENFERYRLKPTVYYAVLETATHYFITYHLFHPRDWNKFTFWVNDTHENDGENLQVVVRKSDDRVILLWTQAHYRSRVYARFDSGIASGRTRVRGEFLTVDSEGRISEAGEHVAVFVETQGHGIYGAGECGGAVGVGDDRVLRFTRGCGLVFRPAKQGEAVDEPAVTASGEAPYQLDSITAKLWPLLRDGGLVGDGKLLDGPSEYRDGLAGIAAVPRYYDGNRFSGPLGSDRGISPFALDFHFRAGTIGALFFNPARRYAEQLEIAGLWSTDYVDYPFR